ncbi:MAG: RNA polymerase sigma factor (TIGR02999 family) [Planctomycetota bacterium]
MSPDQPPDPQHVTRLLDRLNGGDKAASGELLPLIYGELHGIASRVFSSQQSDHTLQATALIHEAYMRILGELNPGKEWNGRHHFYCVAAKAMRHVLIDHARKGRSQKRDGVRVTFAGEIPSDETQYDLIELGDALEGLSKVSERISRVVELRFLGGLTETEVAEELGVSRRSVQGDWRAGRAWLRKCFDNGGAA